MPGLTWRRLLGWERVDATLVDQKFAKLEVDNVRIGTIPHELCDYMVQVPTADGGNRRLVIRARAVRVRDTKNGQKVPVLVNKARTKAAFDFSDPRIDGLKAIKDREAERVKAGEERFKRKLGGR